MKRTLFVLPAVAAVLALSTVCLSAVAVDDLLDKRISLDLKDASVQNVFQLYQEILGVELEIDPTLDGKVSITFENITVRTSLTAVSESAGCRWELSDGDPPVLRVTCDHEAAHGDGAVPRTGLYALESPVTLDLEDADVHEVFGAVAHLLNSRLLIDVALGEESISIRHEERPISDFLDDVCGEIGCEWTFAPGEDPLLSVEAGP
jgi:type II secretory pathway component GspD/PulD (secretin)